MDSLDRILDDMPKRCTLAKLIGYCEGICASGALSEVGEFQLRLHIAETLAAFGMPSQSERSELV